MKGLVVLDAAVLQQATDLYQDRILHLDRLVERPDVGKHATDTARQQDDGGQPDEEPRAQGLCHDGRSTIHPTPRTLRMAMAPSFLRMVWIRNSIALLSTSSFQP